MIGNVDSWFSALPGNTSDLAQQDASGATNQTFLTILLQLRANFAGASGKPAENLVEHSTGQIPSSQQEGLMIKTMSALQIEEHRALLTDSKERTFLTNQLSPQANSRQGALGDSQFLHWVGNQKGRVPRIFENLSGNNFSCSAEETVEKQDRAENVSRYALAIHPKTIEQFFAQLQQILQSDSEGLENESQKMIPDDEVEIKTSGDWIRISTPAEEMLPSIREMISKISDDEIQPIGKNEKESHPGSPSESGKIVIWMPLELASRLSIESTGETMAPLTGDSALSGKNPENTILVQIQTQAPPGGAIPEDDISIPQFAANHDKKAGTAVDGNPPDSDAADSDSSKGVHREPVLNVILSMLGDQDIRTDDFQTEGEARGLQKRINPQLLNEATGSHVPTEPKTLDLTKHGQPGKGREENKVLVEDADPGLWEAQTQQNRPGKRSYRNEIAHKAISERASEVEATIDLTPPDYQMGVGQVFATTENRGFDLRVNQTGQNSPQALVNQNARIHEFEIEKLVSFLRDEIFQLDSGRNPIPQISEDVGDGSVGKFQVLLGGKKVHIQLTRKGEQNLLTVTTDDADLVPVLKKAVDELLQSEHQNGKLLVSVKTTKRLSFESNLGRVQQYVESDPRSEIRSSQAQQNVQKTNYESTNPVQILSGDTRENQSEFSRFSNESHEHFNASLSKIHVVRNSGLNLKMLAEQGGQQHANAVRIGLENIQKIADQIVQSVKTSVTPQFSEIRVQLKPEHFGFVRIVVESQGDDLSGKIYVERSDVKHALETHLPTLHKSLQDQEIRFGRLEVIQTNVPSGDGQFAQTSSEPSQQQLKNSPVFKKENGTGNENNLPPKQKDKVTSDRKFGYNTMEVVI